MKTALVVLSAAVVALATALVLVVGQEGVPVRITVLAEEDRREPAGF